MPAAADTRNHTTHCNAHRRAHRRPHLFLRCARHDYCVTVRWASSLLLVPAWSCGRSCCGRRGWVR